MPPVQQRPSRTVNQDALKTVTEERTAADRLMDKSQKTRNMNSVSSENEENKQLSAKSIEQSEKGFQSQKSSV